MFTAQRGENGEFDGILADLSDPKSPDKIIGTVIDQAGRLDVLVNRCRMPS